MSRTLESTPQLRIVHALAEARKARHHRNCCCRMFDHRYCNSSDKLWSQKVDRELDAFLPAS